MNVAVCFPFYYCADPERYEITRKMLHHWANLAERFDITLIGTGSEGDLSRDLWCQHHPAEQYFEYDQSAWPQQPGAGSCPGLIDKFNRTVEHAREFNPDRVLLVGSDDYLSADYIARMLDSTADMTGPSSAFLAYRDERVWWDGRWGPGWQQLKVCAGIYSFTPAALDKADWRPWQFGQHEGNLELAFTREFGCTLEPISGGHGYWMVKGECVLNSLQLMRDHGYTIEPAAPADVAKFHAVWETL